MSFYQEYETPPPLNNVDDDDDSKLEDGEFNDSDLEQFDTDISTSGIPQHPFYSSSPPPDDNFFEIKDISNDQIELPPIDSQKHTAKEKCDEIVRQNEETVVKDVIVQKSASPDPPLPKNTEIESAQKTETEEIEVKDKERETEKEAIETKICENSFKIEDIPDDDDDDEFHFESFRPEETQNSDEKTETLEKVVDKDDSGDSFDFEFKSFQAPETASENPQVNRNHFETFKATGFSSESEELEFHTESLKVEQEQGVIDSPPLSSPLPHEEVQSSFSFKTQESAAPTSDVNDDIHFEADFSNFEAAFPSPEEPKNIFVNHSTQIHEPQFEIDDDDEDDDFGDFNDFTQATTTVAKAEAVEQPTVQLSAVAPPLSALSTTVKPDINKIIDEFFPYDGEKVFETQGEVEQEERKKSLDVHTDGIIKYLRDIDVTLALNYDYKDSCTHNILVKALGIDKRNILFGPKWSSSASSNVPRFASDLSFNPLQPQKSSIAATTTTSIEKTTVKNAEMNKQSQPQPDVIPEVEFDWSGSGLKNPLDAKQAVKSTGEFLSNPTVDILESSLSSKTTDKVANEESAKHVWTPEESFDLSSNHIVVRERVIKLPETHIFTPIKSVSPVAICKDVSPDDSKSEKTTIYVKEYHDVEYSLEPPKNNTKQELDNDFDDFQSAVLEEDEKKTHSFNSMNNNNKSNNSNSSNSCKADATKMQILVPQNLEVAKPKPTQPPLEILQPQSILKPQPKADLLMPQKVNYSNFHQKEAAVEEKERTPSDDFDFTEFQAAPCVAPVFQPKPIVTTQSPPQPSAKEKINSITLSPMHLVNSFKANNEKPENAKLKYLSNATNHDESSFDDDWSDFVSSQTASMSPKSKSNNLNNDNGWSDFVSVPIVKPPPTTSNLMNSSQFPTKPNFSSWNQPISSKPYAVNHTTSFLSSYQPTDMSERKLNSIGQPMNITNNFNYGVDKAYQSQQQQHGMMPNGISTILPDLHFAMPNNLINLSRTNSTTSSTSAGKK